ncbi:MAG: fimbrillin family protein [Muribaculaceae bacterium]|nr:fimbrillin family protein [Muribaculaceae bacterium]
MKKSNINILRTIPALLLFVLSASCSQDDIEQSVPLPHGQYPLDLTVSVEGMKSRAAGKDNWKDGDEIGVKIGSDDEIGRYTLDKDGNVSIEESAHILHWKTTTPATVNAWYPSEPQTNVSIADQSKLSDFSSIDYLAATAENQSYKNTVGLTFKHRMAKVRCLLTTADERQVSYYDLSDATVTFYGCTVASFAEGELTGDAFGEIIPVENVHNHEALLVPADMTGKELFRIDFNVDGYDKSFSYIPDDDFANLQPGTSYFFTVALSRDEMVVKAISASWDGEPEKIDSESIPISLHFSDDLTREIFEYYADHSENIDWSFEDECYKVHGTTFTISLTLDENGENFLKGFNVTEGMVSVNRVRIENRHVFTFKSNSENVCLEYGDYIQAGDFLYSNGKWRPDLFNNIDVIDDGDDENDDEEDTEINDGDLEDLNRNPNYGYGYNEYKTDEDEKWECIGVVFKVGPGRSDKVENYDGRLETIHGYAVALHDVSAPDEIGNWGGGLKGDAKDAETAIGLYDSFTDLYNGYTNTQKMLQIAAANTSQIDREGEPAYWVFYKLNDYNKTVKAPESSSPWYLPSIGQLNDLYKFSGRRERLLMAGGEEFILSDVGIFPYESTKFDTFGAKYWSSTQHTRDLVWVFRFQGGKVGKSLKLGVSLGSRSSLSRARAVLTF